MLIHVDSCGILQGFPANFGGSVAIRRAKTSAAMVATGRDDGGRGGG